MIKIKVKVDVVDKCNECGFEYKDEYWDCRCRIFNLSTKDVREYDRLDECKEAEVDKK